MKKTQTLRTPPTRQGKGVDVQHSSVSQSLPPVKAERWTCTHFYPETLTRQGREVDTRFYPKPLARQGREVDMHSFLSRDSHPSR
jgi:hypothetical protein